jgi:putative ABC transport system ATP-binding protein
MNIISVKDLVKTYETGEIKVQALGGINIDFAQGEFTAVVGPSGSGKTTFLNMLGGLDKPTSGEILVDNIPVSSLKGAKLVEYRLRNIGFVFQSYNLIPVLTAIENVEFIMHLQGITKKERRNRAVELLNAVGLSDRINSRPSQMSGGQQQRVAVARALASKPRFILADEPTANLDSKSAQTLLEIMEKLNREENITFIFSTHDARVMSKARRIVTMEDGVIASDENKMQKDK